MSYSWYGSLVSVQSKTEAMFTLIQVGVWLACENVDLPWRNNDWLAKRVLWNVAAERCQRDWQALHLITSNCTYVSGVCPSCLPPWLSLALHAISVRPLSASSLDVGHPSTPPPPPALQCYCTDSHCRRPDAQATVADWYAIWFDSSQSLVERGGGWSTSWVVRSFRSRSVETS